jgi:hypothetical protein
MAHKTLIGGTAYEISGGKTLVDGTTYNINGGKTLVGGTAYKIEFGVNWKKYDCIRRNYFNDYTISSMSGWSPFYDGEPFRNFYKNYSFSNSYGFNGIDQISATFSDDMTASEVNAILKGCYRISTADSCVKVNAITEVHATYNGVTGEYLGHYIGGDLTEYEAVRVLTYNKGSVYYGTLRAEEGQLPETGTLVEGSAAEGYCVLQISSTYYYYELEA